MERATLEEGRQDGMTRVRAAAAHTNTGTGTAGGGDGSGAAVAVVEQAALGWTLLSLGEEDEPVAEAEGQEVNGAAAEVAGAEEAEAAEAALAKEAEEAALSSATEINAICVVCEKVAPLNTTPSPAGPAALLVSLP